MGDFRSRIGTLTAAGALAAVLPMCARDPSQAPAPPAETGTGRELRDAVAAMPLGRIVSRDADGTARFVVAGIDPAAPTLDASVDVAARVQLSRHAALLGLTEAAVRSASFSRAHVLAAGASVVQFTQRVNGVDVFRARASVVLDPKKRLVSISTSLHPAAIDRRTVGASLFPAAVEPLVGKALASRVGSSLTVRDDGPRAGDWRGYTAKGPKGSPRVLHAAAKRVLFPAGDVLVPAFQVEFLTRAERSNVNEAYTSVVAADDGRVLYEAPLTENDAFTYRVWADPAGDHAPTHGPLVDYAPHPTGVPGKEQAESAPAVLVTMEGFNKNPQGVADPWLAPTETVTFGNNVRAYSDRGSFEGDGGVMHDDGWDEAEDVRADVTAPKTFDRIYDLTKPPNDSLDQIKAAVTQIFYVTNWLHDFWYDSGFDEAAGVAQLTNYGRGGVEGDPLRAEAQDGADHGEANNANMSTFSDGISPRMQMYVWNGRPNRSIVTTPAITFDDGFGAAAFGPKTFDVAGPAVLSNDASSTTTDACEAPTNVAGKIAVVDRGACDFTVKGANAQAAGALGILLVNNAAGHTPVSPGIPDPAVTIPLLGISREDGEKLKAALAAGSVTVRVIRGVEPPHDGTIDNTVVAHEWGHYLHHRLVICGSRSCGGMSEGWGDFTALMLAIRSDDDLSGTAFPLSQYATQGLLQTSAYFGIRRAPYSTDFNKNPFTFQHVRKSSSLPTTAPLARAAVDMNEVHNVGEIWAATLFEAYAGVIAAGKAASPPRAFEESRRRMADYVVAGMKAAPTEPTFTEQRDALLAAVAATGHKDDLLAMAQAFAKRGLGVGAVSPPTSSTTLDEAVANFDRKGKLDFVDATVDDSVRSCDHDGVLDGNEAGTLTVRVRNVGWTPLTKTTVKVTSIDPNVTIANDGAANVGPIDPYGVASVTLGISASASLIGRAVLPIEVQLNDADAMAASLNASVRSLYNYDDVPKSSLVEDAESPHSPWTFGHGAKALDAWSRQGDGANHVWHGDDLAAKGDESLISPDIVVGRAAPFTIAFDHRYRFEQGPPPGGGADVYYDGGVLEISEDGGTTWTDVSKFVDPKYPHPIYESTQTPDSNALAGRPAWTGTSAGYPSFTNVVLNLGTQLAGKTIKLRFRIGSDEASGAAGWDVDTIVLSGITNKPFASVIDDTRTCTDGGAPMDGGVDADAGETDDAGGASSSSGQVTPLPPFRAVPSADSDDGCAMSRSSHGAPSAPVLFGVLGLMLARRRRRGPARAGG